MQPNVKAFFNQPTFTVSYVVSDPNSPSCVIIDSVLDFDAPSGCTSTTAADEIVAYIGENGLKPEWILETHAHADHLSAAPYLKGKLGGKTAVSEHIRVVQETFGKLFNAGPEFATDGGQFDRLLADGEEIAIGGLTARVLHTPGHTPACVSYVIGDAVFVGDTIFMPDFGTARVDFPGGCAQTLYRSIRRILALPLQTRVFTCHDYKAGDRDVFAWESTVAKQRAENIHVHDGITEDTFIYLRTERDKLLTMPALILPAIQVNMRAGEMPPPDENGVSYLKLPLNVF